MTRYDKVLAEHERESERQIERDVAEVLQSPAGRRLLMAALGKSGIYARSRRDSLEYDAGRRDCGLSLMHIANRHALQMVELAQREFNEMTMRRNAELRRADEEDQKERKTP